MLRFPFENILERAETPMRLSFLFIFICCWCLLFILFLFLFGKCFRFLALSFFFLNFCFNFFFSFLQSSYYLMNHEFVKVKETSVTTMRHWDVDEKLKSLKIPDVFGFFNSIFSQGCPKQIVVFRADKACWMLTLDTDVIPSLLISLIPLEIFVAPVI